MAIFEAEITFKPLKSGKYRCNQTGVVVTKAMIPGYRASLLNQGKRVLESLIARRTTEPK
jgi:hypothetical protein